MLCIIILLYALNAAYPVPTGCFVAAWTICVIEVICELIKFVIKKIEDKNNR